MKVFFRKHSALLISTLINLIFACAFIALCGVNYELSDDWFFSANIANGKFDFIFNSYFIQVLTGFLQKLIFPVNAYMLLQIVFCFVALVTIGYVFIKAFSVKKGILLTLLIEGIFAVNFYSVVTFTKTAVALIVAGFLIALFAFFFKRNIGYYIYGVLLVVFGSFYRLDVFYTIAAVGCAFFAALFFARLKKPIFKSAWELIKKAFCLKNTVALVMTLALVFGLNIASEKIMNSEDGMDYYNTYNHARSLVVDFILPPYETYKEKYEDISISQNDYEMIQSWYLDDEGATDLDTLQSIHNLQTEYRYGGSKVGIIKTMIVKLVGDALTSVKSLSAEGVLILAYILLLLYCLIAYKKSFLFCLFITAANAVLYMYLWYVGRFVYRAVFSIWMAAFVLLLFSTVLLCRRKWSQKAYENKKRAYCGALSIFCVLCTVALCFFSVRAVTTNETIKNNEDYGAVEEYIVSQKDKSFVLGSSANLLLRNSFVIDNALDISDNEAYSKCIYLGSAYYAHPSYNELLSSFSVSNTYRDIIDNDNFYFIDNNQIEMFVDYLNDYYANGRVISASKVTEVQGLSIYKIVSQ